MPARSTRLSGALFDLGVSSPQLDRAERGFSYRHDGPLDMRMDPTQPWSAADVVNGYDEDDLARRDPPLRRRALRRRIARAIVAARPIESTGQLAEIVTTAIPAATRRTGGHPAKRTFQAIRIEVNGELEVLPVALDEAIDATVPGGRVAVLTYHSGEDRIVKERFRRRDRRLRLPAGSAVRVRRASDACGSSRGIAAPAVASDELAANPRAALGPAAGRRADRRASGDWARRADDGRCPSAASTPRAAASRVRRGSAPTPPVAARSTHGDVDPAELRLVPRRRAAVNAALLLVVVVVALMLAAVVLHTQLDRAPARDRPARAGRSTEAHERFDVLRRQRAELRSPTRLATEGAELGMTSPPNDRVRRRRRPTLAAVDRRRRHRRRASPARSTPTDPLDQFRRVKAATAEAPMSRRASPRSTIDVARGCQPSPPARRRPAERPGDRRRGGPPDRPGTGGRRPDREAPPAPPSGARPADRAAPTVAGRPRAGGARARTAVRRGSRRRPRARPPTAGRRTRRRTARPLADPVHGRPAAAPADRHARRDAGDPRRVLVQVGQPADRPRPTRCATPAPQQWTRDRVAGRPARHDLRPQRRRAGDVGAGAHVTVNPQQVEDPAGTADTFAQILGLDAERRDELERRWRPRTRASSYVARQVDTRVADQIAASAGRRRRSTGGPAHHARRRDRPQRDRPHRHRRQGHRRAGAAVRRRSLQRHARRDDRSRSPRGPVDPRHRAGRRSSRSPGSDLVLTIDRSVQFAAEQALLRRVGRDPGQRRQAIVMDTDTGEMLAMASVRLTDDGGVRGHVGQLRRVDAYEPGSVAKVITIAAALNEGTVTPRPSSSCRGKGVHPARRHAHDSHQHPDELMTVEQILVESSNIGTITVSEPIGFEQAVRVHACVRPGEKTALDFPGENPGHPQALEGLGGVREVHGRLRPGLGEQPDPARLGRQHDRQRRHLRGAASW